MKFGFRKPNIKKNIKARTTGRIKRAAKSSINPLYGKKGMGFINNPQKAIYNKIYNKTTIGVSDIMKNNSYAVDPIIANAPYSNLTLEEIKEKNKQKANKKVKDHILALKLWKYSNPIIILLTLLLCIVFPFLLVVVILLILLEQKIIQKIKELENKLEPN